MLSGVHRSFRRGQRLGDHGGLAPGEPDQLAQRQLLAVPEDEDGALQGRETVEPGADGFELRAQVGAFGRRQVWVGPGPQEAVHEHCAPRVAAVLLLGPVPLGKGDDLAEQLGGGSSIPGES